MEAIVLIPIIAVALVIIIALARSVRIVPQQQAYVVERLGRYRTTLKPGLNLLAPFLDRVRARIDLRERVVSFEPQPVITSDNLVVSIDTVLYFQITNASAAVYEIASYLRGIEQLTVTTLRNTIGSLDLERALTSREHINGHLHGVLDEATAKWGIRVNRVEIKAIEPPASIRDSMEKQMRAERSRRAAILTAEGVKQSRILTAEGERQSMILRAQGDQQAQILQAEGRARAIRQVADAIHRAKPDQKLLAFQYLQALPQIAENPTNTLWMVPAELTRALAGLGAKLGAAATGADDATESAPDNASAADEESAAALLGLPDLPTPALPRQSGPRADRATPTGS